MELCLDSLTLTDTDPVELILAASHTGFDCVSLWVQPPPLFPSPLVTTGNERACASVLADTDLRVGPLECFDLSSAEAVRSYRPALELGARLGGTFALAINVGNLDASAVSAHLAQLTELAGDYGLGVNFEPLATFATSTLGQAASIIRAAGVDVGIVLDVFHLVREGASSTDVQAVVPELIRHVQLSDGARSASIDVTRHEMVNERAYPGDGEFPFADLLKHVPRSCPWAIEAPSRARAQRGLSPRQQAAEALAAMRRTIATI